MKREAEEYLGANYECRENLYNVILRPGLVYHDKERPVSMPLGFASNLVHSLGGIPGIGQQPAATNLKHLADFTIREALVKREKAGNKLIDSTQMKA